MQQSSVEQGLALAVEMSSSPGVLWSCSEEPALCHSQGAALQEVPQSVSHMWATRGVGSSRKAVGVPLRSSLPFGI